MPALYRDGPGAELAPSAPAGGPASAVRRPEDHGSVEVTRRRKREPRGQRLGPPPIQEVERRSAVDALPLQAEAEMRELVGPPRLVADPDLDAEPAARQRPAGTTCAASGTSSGRRALHPVPAACQQLNFSPCSG
jgi:hypothetical protein